MIELTTFEWVCLECKEHPRFSNDAMFRHLTAVHRISAASLAAQKFVSTFVSDGICSDTYEVAIGDMKFLQIIHHMDISARFSRAIACAQIERAFKDASAPESLHYKYRIGAKAYLHGPNFELDAQLLGLDEYVKQVRGMVSGTYQPELVEA